MKNFKKGPLSYISVSLSAITVSTLIFQFYGFSRTITSILALVTLVLGIVAIIEKQKGGIIAIAVAVLSVLGTILIADHQQQKEVNDLWLQRQESLQKTQDALMELEGF